MYRKGFPVVEEIGLSHKSMWFDRVKMIVGFQFKAFRCAKDSTNQGDSEGTNPSVNQFAPSAVWDK